MTTFAIDRTWLKSTLHPPGYGYGRYLALQRRWIGARPGVPSSIVDHSTNGAKGSAFADEARFLRDSPQLPHPDGFGKGVSAHFLVGKVGQIARIVDEQDVAWHAGAAWDAFDNFLSFGIEHHHAVGDSWPTVQLQASAWLHKYLIKKYSLTASRIETHRRIALPAGRKSDPNDWADADFYAWRDRLFEAAIVDTLIIGGAQSADIDHILRSFSRNNQFAHLSEDEIRRMYAFCEWLQVDMCALLAMAAHETGTPFLSSATAQQTNNWLNIKAPADDWRHTWTDAQGRRWYRYQSAQLGFYAAVLHLKEQYGAEGLLTLEQIVPVFAPPKDGNDPASYVQDVRATMQYIQTH